MMVTLDILVNNIRTRTEELGDADRKDLNPSQLFLILASERCEQSYLDYFENCCVAISCNNNPPLELAKTAHLYASPHVLQVERTNPSGVESVVVCALMKMTIRNVDTAIKEQV